MILFLYLSLLLLFVQEASAGICSSNSVIPFSGYKITRRHKIRLHPLKSDSFLVLTKCHRGIPLFSRTVPTSSTLDEFATPFCKTHTEFDFSDPSRKEHRRPFPPSPWTRNASANAPGLLSDRISRSLRLKNMRLKDWLPFSSKKFESQENVSEEKSTVAKKIHRKGTKSGKRHQPHIPVSCLKMARRKRYARSDVVIFIPATFVGVLFACDQEYAPVSGVSRINSVFDQPSAKASVEISSSDGSEEVLPNAEKLTHSPGKPFPAKKHYRVLHRKKITKRSLKSAPQEDSPDSDAEELDAEEPYSEEIPFSFTGRPVCPLVADDYSSHWISVQFSPPALIYHVPYLRSPSIWDPRFKSSYSHASPKWDNEVDINERYTYSQVELSLIGNALMASARYVHRLFNMKKAKLSKLLAFKIRWIRKFDPRVQLSLFLFSLGKPVAFRHVVRLQKFWDSLSRANASVIT